MVEGSLTQSRRSGCGLDHLVLWRDRVVGALAVPGERDDPPSGAVVHELDRMDAAVDRLGIPRRVARLERRKDLADFAEALLLPRHFVLVERSGFAPLFPALQELAHALLKRLAVE